jgi:DnaJ-like protein C11, C-terminal
MRLTRTLSGSFVVAIFLALAAANAAAQTYYVQSADYGWGNKRMDVTSTVRRLVNGPNFTVNNKNLGVDPAVGKDKTLRIVGRAQNGKTLTFTYNEGAIVNSQMFAGNWGGGGPGGGWGGGGPTLRILNANYVPADGGGGRDVTPRLQSMVRNDRLNVNVTNQTMGGDPAVGRTKKLAVVYQFQGRTNNVTIPEGGRLSIP